MMLQNKLTRSILLAGGISALAACGGGGGSSSGSTATDSSGNVPKYLVLNASTTGSNHTLWRTDGTVEGTKTLNSSKQYYRGQTSFNGKVYFISNTTFGGSVYKNYAWVSDGNTDIQIKDANNNPITHVMPYNNKNEMFVAAGGKLYFMGRTGSHSSDRKLYQINADGLTATAVADFTDLTSLPEGSDTRREIDNSGKPFSDGKHLYFSIRFATLLGGGGYSWNSRPYRINLTLNTTHKLERLSNAAGDTINLKLNAAYSVNGQTFLLLTNKVYTLGAAKNSLVELTGGSPDKLLQLGDGSLIGYTPSSRSFYTVSNSGLSSITLNGSSLSGSWNSSYIQVPGASQPEIIGHSKLYFLYGNSAPYDMISIDKTGTVTKLGYGSEITQLLPDATSAKKLQLLTATYRNQTWRANNHVLFAASAATSSYIGDELWAINEATSTIDITKDVHNSSNTSSAAGQALNSNPNILGVINNKLIFDAFGGSGGTNPSGRELWSSDGTTTGTTMIKDIASGSLNGVDNNITF